MNTKPSAQDSPSGVAPTAAKVLRLFTGDDGESHFEDIEFPMLDRGELGTLSAPVEAESVLFRGTGAQYDFGWHNAPQRQFVIMLSGGGVEIEVGDGSKRRLGPGDILLAEDTTGRGHISRACDDQARLSLFIPLR